jgi:hypothetical protein
MYQTDTIEQILEQNLGPVEAPEELWNRIAQGRQVARSAAPVRKLAWALATAVVVAGITWNLPRPEFQSEDPAQIRAWVKQRTGLDLPLASSHAAPVHVAGVRVKSGGAVEVAYRDGSRKATFIVSRTVAGEKAHWSSGGQSYSLACAIPADLDGACRLCHADAELN